MRQPGAPGCFMEMFLPDDVKQVLVGLIATAFVLGLLARKFPDVTWLQFFRLPQSHLSEKELARRRRSGDRLAAFEMIGAGFLLPLFYMLVTVMTFNEFETMPTLIVGACSVLCVVAGIWILVRTSRD